MLPTWTLSANMPEDGCRIIISVVRRTIDGTYDTQWPEGPPSYWCTPLFFVISRTGDVGLQSITRRTPYLLVHIFFCSGPFWWYGLLIPSNQKDPLVIGWPLISVVGRSYDMDLMITRDRKDPLVIGEPPHFCSRPFLWYGLALPSNQYSYWWTPSFL